MSSPATRLPRSARLGLAAVTLLVAGCQDYAARRDTLAFHSGEAAAHNKAVHVIDPWPAAAVRSDIEFDGSRAVRTIERYEAGGTLTIPSGGAAPAAPNGGAAAASPLPSSAIKP
jgi:hypothetical protein